MSRIIWTAQTRKVFPNITGLFYEEIKKFVINIMWYVLYAIAIKMD